MVGSDVTSAVRTIIGEPNVAQRWNDAQIMADVSFAQGVICREINWPNGRFTFTTVAGTQEYVMPEVLQILNVYVQGQPLVRTDRATLQGDQIGMYDQTGSGGGPGGLIPQDGPSPLVGSAYTPQWTGQPSEIYPVPSSLGYPVPPAQPWIAGMRPEYYTNGGNLGLVPPPAGAYPVVVDAVLPVAPISQTTDRLVLPNLALDAVVWKTIELMLFANSGNDYASEQRNYAVTQYEKAMLSVKTWARRYDGNENKGPKPLTMRSFFTRGNNRNWGDTQ